MPHAEAAASRDHDIFDRYFSPVRGNSVVRAVANDSRGAGRENCATANAEDSGSGVRDGESGQVQLSGQVDENAQARPAAIQVLG